MAVAPKTGNVVSCFPESNTLCYTIMTRNVLTCLLICSVYFCAGCARPSIKDKERSLASVGEITIADVPLKVYLGQRIGFALKNAHIEDTEIDSGQLQATFKKQGGHGLACAVSEDGYFLTAFHVAGDAESLHMITGQDAEKVFRHCIHNIGS